MTPQEAVKKVFPQGNPNLTENTINRIKMAVPKVENKILSKGSSCAVDGSINHFAMIIIAEKHGLKIEIRKGIDADIACLKLEQ